MRCSAAVPAAAAAEVDGALVTRRAASDVRLCHDAGVH